MKDATIHNFDAIIVGGGGAGLYAALQACGEKLRIAVVSKLHPIRSHTGAAQGGIAASLGNMGEDQPHWHAYDTVKGGDYLVDQQAALILAENAAKVVYHLEHLGLPFSRTEQGRIAQRRFGGHTHHFGKGAVMRTCYAADRIGHLILHTLYQQCLKQQVQFFDEYHVIHLFLDEQGRCGGVAAVCIADGSLHVFCSRAVLFATGGAGRLYKITSNALENTGDGAAICARAGVPLEDFEFYQFHPTGLRGIGVLITEGTRGEGGILRNCEDEAFMQRYSPKLGDLAPRDMVARAITLELLAGRGIERSSRVDDYVHLDATHLGAQTIMHKLPDVREFCRTYVGVDPIEQPIPVHPTAHYTMGGIPTDINGQVGYSGQTFLGLYAAGECACVSVHGANRLGSNSLLDLLVFGKSAGESLQRYLASAPPCPKLSAGAEIEQLWSKIWPSTEAETAAKRKDSGPELASIYDKLQLLMAAKVGVFRNEQGLGECIEELKAVRQMHSQLRVSRQSSSYNYHALRIFELGCMIDLAEIVAAGARARKESRGSHAREDYPERDDAQFLKHTMAHLDIDHNGRRSIRLSYDPVDTSIWEPKPRVY